MAIDFRGEVYAIAKWAGIRTKDVRERLGNERDLPGVEETKAAIAAKMTPVLQGYIREAERAHQVKAERHRLERTRMAEHHRAERRTLEQGQEERWSQETAERAARFSKGFRGLWDRLTGRYAEIRRQNEHETFMAWRRDQAQRETLISSQLDERQRLQERILEVRRNHARERDQLEQGVAAYLLGQKSERDMMQERPTRGPEEGLLRDRDGPGLDIAL